MLLRFQKVEGMKEDNSLEPRERFLKEFKLPKHAGIGRESLLCPSEAQIA